MWIELVLVLVALIYLLLLRRIDKYEPEPYYIMVLSTVIGGIVSVGITLFLYSLSSRDFGLFEHFILVGPVEEFSKMFALLIIFLLFKRQINEPLDGVIYMCCVALGFATIENHMYVTNSNNSISLLIIRSTLCVVAHMSFSMFMGFSLYAHFLGKRNFIGILLTFLFAILLHGAYNTSLSYPGILLPIAGLTLPSALALIYIFIIYVRSVSPFFPVFDLSKFKKSKKQKHYYCCLCEREANDIIFRKKNIEIQVCDQCEKIVFDRSNWRDQVQYFAPLTTSRWEAELMRLKQNQNEEMAPGILAHPGRGWFNVDAAKWRDALEENHALSTLEVLKRDWRGRFLELIGAKKLLGL